MNKDLENLINLSIINGEIAESKRLFLQKKALELGESLDELSIIIEGKLHQQKQSKEKVQEQVIPEKKLSKCPSCGDVITGLSKVCNSCGYVLTSSSNSSDIEKNIEILEDNIVKIKAFPKFTMWDDLVTIVFSVATWGLYALYKIFYLKKPLFSGKQLDEFVGKSEKQIRTIRNLYSEDKKINILADEFEKELADTLHQRKRAKKNARIVSLIIFGLILILIVRACMK